ncbi:PREDICTED: protein FAR-RED IMPAIRED RESPONSE 1-like [Camelina sativa]|uniref:Protein FAR1-RELATED SEQUENCE n=1 Tax=Camelina sativa TaxID=90675 RepID=A0ABM0Y5K4_CAMSA|nr:PREDICTED: protein FAR-RED IMPAIRED RESPONSE 1-like [Camelina sativa]XP_010495887.1 PREDICTED: protein FAR-RED IMPAIRED RESPONSE 1-like [Camelina sativa]XP_010495888.1 PREDICTED: protein FAR-RED IMPAIRED RESPONSE 1-like [Camelina sativa]XP_010495889.1 PREDICTED: protein FAR-RED IMPAIRED RESPONSE 1-like [Camelina sativa]
MDLQENQVSDHAGDECMVDIMVDSSSSRDVGIADDLKAGGDLGFSGDVQDHEPRNGINFESNDAAYLFYQEYAKSMGFTTSIKNSRRSKKTKEFIDAKFACSRYGVTPETEGSSSSRRSSIKKTDCKASMHVKRRPDGKWIIHEFIKDHNHELLPALAYHFRIQRNVKLAEKNNIDILHAVSERTRKMYVEMSRQSGGYKNNGPLLQSDVNSQVGKGRYLALEEGDSQVLLEYFKRIKKENPKFFYAIDLNEEQRLRNLFWADAKSRDDYLSFNDVVSFDTTYVKFNDKLPLALFIGVNHHSQPMLLGCALVADESKETFVWLIKTWLRAMGGRAPSAILTDQDKFLMAAVSELLPNTRHCIALWHVIEKIPEYFSIVMKRHENFLKKFNECIFRSWTDDEFDMRWWKMVSQFGLENDEWLLWLHEHRQKWVPTFMSGVFLAGMSTSQRSESVNAFFDKYVHKKITLKEFLRQYGAILQNRYEEESVADFDTCHKQPALKSPSPWEKQMATTYTHTIFKKFQVEVLGVVACHPRKEKEDDNMATFRVQDVEKDDEFLVTWSKSKSELCCFCRMFEYKGYLCRHALMILQMCGFASIPPQYILKRWTKDAKSGVLAGEGADQIQTRVQRYNDLCSRAIELSEEGCVSEENYNIVLRTLVETLKNCVDLNNARNSMIESSSQLNNGAHEEESQEMSGVKATKKKTVCRKRKGQQEADQMLESQQSLQPMETISSEGMGMNGYYGPQQNGQGLLNLMEPPHEGYYVNQRTIQGLGQLNSIAPVQDSFFANQQAMPGLGQMDFRPPPNFNYNLQEEHLRSAQLPGNSSRQL